jgi:hypothetical protein
MATFVEITGDPDEIRANAARMGTSGETIQAKSAELHDAVSGIEAEQPWGHDKFGVEFLKGYQPDGGEGSPGEDPAAQLGRAGAELTKMSEGVTWAVTDYQSSDAQAADDIGKLA